MLANDDLNAIKVLVTEIVEPEFKTVRSDIKKTRSDIKRTEKRLTNKIIKADNIIIQHFDQHDGRIEHLENLLQISPAN